MNTEQQYYPWNEGQPTKPDVDALMKAFPPESLAIGRRIADSEILAVLGTNDAARYRTVYSAWIRRLQRDHGINLFREKEEGFFVPSAAEVCARTYPALQHIGRTAKKQMRNLGAAKPETDDERRVIDHQGRLLHQISRESKKARINVLPPSGIAPAPQITPPKAGT